MSKVFHTSLFLIVLYSFLNKEFQILKNISYKIYIYVSLGIPNFIQAAIKMKKENGLFAVRNL